eukprot:TRINITY_DN555_c0_g1_i1.p1 TRINITY_DN555_c0_g1~~TRINITY_DN555_c0_g1_i1.p1  ORF type:complete len:288 (-),score=60.52 TRINITY_DN555_c0_g1_i1:567-1430(-)
MGIGARTPLRVRKKNLKNPSFRQVAVVKVGSKQGNTGMKYNNRKRDSSWGGGAVDSANVKFKQVGVYEPPRLQDLKWQNRLKTKRHYIWRNPPHAPRNTSTYILQSKRAGAFEFLTSPAIDSTSLAPASSPLPLYKEGVVEEVKQWGVDGYGSMTNLIRLRSSSDDEQMGAVHFDGTFNGDGVQSGDTGAHSMRGVEQRLEQDLVRFELTYPPRRMEDQYALQRRVEEQEQQIAFLEDENLTLRERVYILQQEMGDLRQRLGLTTPARLDVPDDAYSELVDPLSDAV